MKSPKEREATRHRFGSAVIHHYERPTGEIVVFRLWPQSRFVAVEIDCEETGSRLTIRAAHHNPDQRRQAVARAQAWQKDDERGIL